MMRRDPCPAFLVCTLLLAACLPRQAELPSPQEVENVQTAAAQTVIARFTLSAGETAVAQLTAMADQATATLPPVTQPSASSTPSPQPPLPTETFSPTLPPPTSPPPSPSPTPLTPATPCDRAEFIQDISVPPNTTLLSGARFIKTWRVRNTGACIWLDAYALVFTGGHMLSNSPVVFLPGSVQPGQVIDLSIPMIAPSTPGSYQGYWALRNASGVIFGSGSNADTFLESRLQVIRPVNWAGFAFDLSADYCAANWQSNAGTLNCPGSTQDPNGWVLLLANPVLESDRSSEYGLWIHPQAGWISGLFPAYTVIQNDHFITEIGCPIDSLGCYLTVQVDYRTSDGLVGTLGKWREALDGQSTPIDIDLSPLAGKSTLLSLTVTNNGDANNADALWLAPRIQNLAPKADLVYSWTRKTEQSPACSQLNLYLASNGNGEARAYSCQQDQHEIGRIGLTAEEVTQILGWVQRLRDFGGEIYQASANQPVLIWIDFQGQGNTDASDADIQAISRFAEALFNKIAR